MYPAMTSGKLDDFINVPGDDEWEVGLDERGRRMVSEVRD